MWNNGIVIWVFLMLEGNASKITSAVRNIRILKTVHLDIRCTLQGSKIKDIFGPVYDVTYYKAVL